MDESSDDERERTTDRVDDDEYLVEESSEEVQETSSSEDEESIRQELKGLKERPVARKTTKASSNMNNRLAVSGSSYGGGDRKLEQELLRATEARKRSSENDEESHNENDEESPSEHGEENPSENGKGRITSPGVQVANTDDGRGQDTDDSHNNNGGVDPNIDDETLDNEMDNILDQMFAPKQIHNKDKPASSKKKKRKRKSDAADFNDDDINDDTKRARNLELARQNKLKDDTKTVKDEDVANENTDVEHYVSDTEREQGIRLTNFATNDPDTKTVRLCTTLSKVLKPHQIRGVRFVWSHVSAPPDGFGCILADYMGLGKTIQVISIMHTFLQQGWIESKDDNVPEGCKRTVLILAPASVVRNWKAEMQKWFPSNTSEGRRAMELFSPLILNASTANTLRARTSMLKKWHKQGGILVIGYEMFRSLAAPHQPNKTELKASELITTPSMVVVDEGHRLRKKKSQIVRAVHLLKTQRRVILTGYPLQNHLSEYWCMVNFARPDYLGRSDEFKTRFDTPITNGQAMDSTPNEVALAKARTFVLLELLRPLVLRRDSSHLAKSLPPKCEWVVHCRMSKIQAQLYRAFVRNRIKKYGVTNKGILEAYHQSLSIVNHPDILFINVNNARNGISSIETTGFAEDDDEDAVDDDDGRLAVRGNTNEDDALQPANSQSSNQAEDDGDDEVQFLESIRVQGDTGFEWAAPLLRSYPEEPQLEYSGKMVVLFALLNAARRRGDKTIVFSQSVVTLKLIRALIDRHNQQVVRGTLDESFRKGGSAKGELGAPESAGYLQGVRCGYLCIFGSTPQAQRHPLVDKFNKADISEYAVFLASTRAAGEGLNLQSANRVVMFDMCWNPCLDHEAMCRSYRFGQKKEVSVYRLVGGGTMEEKIYDQQIRKETLTHKVIDDRALGQTSSNAKLKDFFNLQHFNSLQKKTEGSNPTGTESLEKREAMNRDSIFMEVLGNAGDLITKFSLEDLLMNENENERLSPEQRKRALEALQKQEVLENQLMAQGHPAGTASAMAMQHLAREYPDLGFYSGAMMPTYQPHPSGGYVDAGGQAMAPAGGQVVAPAGSPGTMVGQVEAPPNQLSHDAHQQQMANVRAGLFGNAVILILRRKMDPKVHDQTVRRALEAGGRVVYDMSVHTTHVISEWPPERLNKWLKTQQDNLVKEYKAAGIDIPDSIVKLRMNPFFRTPRWLQVCVGYNEILELNDPRLAEESGNAESSLGMAGSSLGMAGSSLGMAELPLGTAGSSLGTAESSLGTTESSQGAASGVGPYYGTSGVAPPQGSNTRGEASLNSNGDQPPQGVNGSGPSAAVPANSRVAVSEGMDQTLVPAEVGQQQDIHASHAGADMPVSILDDSDDDVMFLE